MTEIVNSPSQPPAVEASLDTCPYLEELPTRILKHFTLLKGDYSAGTYLDPYDHSLQAATRAYRHREDEEYVVCTLLHDIGDVLGTYNHGEVSAAILRPFISEKNRWMVQHHDQLQEHIFYEGIHYLGINDDAYERLRDHPHLEHALRFCKLYDQPSYDPEYDTLPLEAFIPMVERVLARPTGEFCPSHHDG